MCHFTLVTHALCNCTSLLTAPQNTILCQAAITMHCVQGIDAAPAYCHPLLDDEEDRYTEYGNVVYGYCPECRPAAVENLNEDKQELIGMREQESAVYGEHEVEALGKLRTAIEQTQEAAQRIATASETTLTAHPEFLERIPTGDIRALLQRPGPEKYDILFLSALDTCTELLKCLEALVQQRVPARVFLNLFHFVERKMGAAGNCAADLECLVTVMKEGSEHLMSTGAVGALAEGVLAYLKMERLGVKPEPFAHLGLGEELEEVEEVEASRGADIEAATKTSSAVSARRCGSVDHALPLREQDLRIPLGMRHASRTRNTIEGRDLSVVIPEGLQDDEPAREIEIEHRPFREQDSEAREDGIESEKHREHREEPVKMGGEDVGRTYALPDSEDEDEDDEEDEADDEEVLAAPSPEDDTKPMVSQTRPVSSASVPEPFTPKSDDIPSKKRPIPEPDSSAQEQIDDTFISGNRPILPLKKKISPQEKPAPLTMPSNFPVDLNFDTFASYTKQSLFQSQAPPSLSAPQLPKRTSNFFSFLNFATRSSPFRTPETADRVEARMRHRSLSAASLTSQAPIPTTRFSSVTSPIAFLPRSTRASIRISKMSVGGRDRAREDAVERELLHRDRRTKLTEPAEGGIEARDLWEEKIEE